MRDTLRSHHAPVSITLSLAAALGAASLLYACGGGYGGGGGSGGSNPCGGVYMACPLPTVSVTAPAAGTVTGTVALTATATASTANGLTVSRVDFMIDGTVVGTASAAPYTVNWDSTTVGNGNHTLTAKVTDSMSDTATSAAVTLNVMNAAAMNSAMTPAQVFPAPRSSALGSAAVSVKLPSGALSGKVTLTGLNARSVTLNRGFAGASGEVVLALTPGASGEWSVPSGALLSAEQARALMRGEVYVLATSNANPRGELRGQLAPEGVTVTFSALSVSPRARELGISAAGVAAVTLDTRAGTLAVNVNSVGVEDAMQARVQSGSGSAAPALAALVKNDVDMGHWSSEPAHIDATDMARLRAGQWALSVATPALPEGALVGAIEAPRAD